MSKKWIASLGVTLFLASASMSSALAQSSMSAPEYVDALTRHLANGGEVTELEIQNINNLVSQGAGGVEKEAFIRLGNALYQTGHLDLGERVMTSDVIVADRYMGATLQVQMGSSTEQSSPQQHASSSSNGGGTPEAVSTRDQVEQLFDDIYGSHGVDRGSAEWFANAVDRGELTLTDVEGRLQHVYNARFGTPGKLGPNGARPYGVSPQD